MFSFIKNKLKKAVDAFGKKTEEEADVKELEQEHTKEQTPVKKPVTKKKESAKKERPIKKTVSKKETTETPSQLSPQKEAKKPVQKKPEQVSQKEKSITKPKQELQQETTPKQEDIKESITQTTEQKQEEVDQKISEEKTEQEVRQEEPEKKSFFGKLKEKFTKVQLSEEKFDDLFWELELAMLENNVAVEVIEKIKQDLKKTLTSGTVTRKGVQGLIQETLKESIEELFIEPYDLVKKTSGKKPYVIAFIGVNGSGKTTTLAKVANLFQTNDKTIVMSASDTFRAAAIDQLQAHANKLGIKLISQGYGADPAAVAYDAIEHAKAKKLDIVMIDTAGRLHSNNNLMAELEKVIRVAKPDLKIFIGESITGNDCVEQAQEFNKRVGIDAIILSKADIDEKGGAALSVSYVTKKPILYLGVGQSYGDLEAFDKERIIKSLGL